MATHAVTSIFQEEKQLGRLLKWLLKSHWHCTLTERWEIATGAAGGHSLRHQEQELNTDLPWQNKPAYVQSLVVV